jgi:hypothetical protein
MQKVSGKVMPQKVEAVHINKQGGDVWFVNFGEPEIRVDYEGSCALLPSHLALGKYLIF